MRKLNEIKEFYGAGPIIGHNTGLDHPRKISTILTLHIILYVGNDVYLKNKLGKLFFFYYQISNKIQNSCIANYNTWFQCNITMFIEFEYNLNDMNMRCITSIFVYVNIL